MLCFLKQLQFMEFLMKHLFQECIFLTTQQVTCSRGNRAARPCHPPTRVHPEQHLLHGPQPPAAAKTAASACREHLHAHGAMRTNTGEGTEQAPDGRAVIPDSWAVLKDALTVELD